MTDTERERIKAICEVAGVSDIDDLSDGYHTFGQLYYQRMMLFAVIVKQNHDRAWKSPRHEDGELCFGGGWFIVGIDTPEGSYTYHYENKYFDLFDCEELERGKHWDGHTEKDVTRLLSLPTIQPEQTGIDAREAVYNLAEKIGIHQLFALTVELRGEPIQPEPKEGHWILHESPDGGEQYECSECGVLWEFTDGTPEDNEAYFCPKCGTKMTISTK